MALEDEHIYAYDVFISYSHADYDWVWKELLPQLEGAGLRVCIDERDFEVGLPILVNIERAIANSRHTLTILTPGWLQREWANFEGLLVETADPAALRRRLLPLMLIPCEPPARMRMLTVADFTRATSRAGQFDRLMRQLRATAATPSAPSKAAVSLVVEQQQPAAPKMLDNPYVVGVPLSPVLQVSLARPDVGTRILELVRDRRRPFVLLYGQRRMGTTSFLMNLGGVLPKMIVPLLVDMEAPASDYAGLLSNIAKSMTASAEREQGLRLPPLAPDGPTADPSTHFEAWLDQVEEVLGERTALVTLDSVGKLSQDVTAASLPKREVIGILRRLQHRPHFRVLLAGFFSAEELHRWTGDLIHTQMARIGYLDESEALDLIERPMAGFPLRYDPGASQRVLDLTRCHPFLLQLLCREIVTLKSQQNSDLWYRVGVADVEAAVPELLRHGSVFADLLHDLVDAPGTAMLRLLAEAGEDATIDWKTLISEWDDEDQAHRSLDVLLQNEVIEATRAGYRFKLELVRRWFV